MDYPGMNTYDPNQIARMKQIEEMKRQLMSRILTKEAFERLGRVRAVNPNLAATAELYLLQLQQAGQLKGTINEEQLKQILGTISQSEKKDFSIKRK
jgi:programmed cell death protein 5